MEAIAENTDIKPVKIYLPIGKEGAFEGVVDIIKRKAIKAGKESEVPTNLVEAMEEARIHLMEAVAETDEDLLNEYLENMELPEDKLIEGLKKGILSGKISPAFVCSAGTGEGVLALLNGIINYLPSPAEANEIEVLKENEKTAFICQPDGELLGYIFKLYADPGMGDFVYFRLFSGTLKTGMEFYIPEKDAKDKAGTMYFMLGKNRNDCNEIKAGDIGALLKLKNAKVMNSIVSLGSKISVIPVELPTPTTWQTIKAVNQADEDKIGTVLQRVIAEDPTIRYELNVETHENVLSGMGEQQLQLVLKGVDDGKSVNIPILTNKRDGGTHRARGAN